MLTTNLELMRVGSFKHGGYAKEVIFWLKQHYQENEPIDLLLILEKFGTSACLTALYDIFEKEKSRKVSNAIFLELVKPILPISDGKNIEKFMQYLKNSLLGKMPIDIVIKIFNKYAATDLEDDDGAYWFLDHENIIGKNFKVQSWAISDLIKKYLNNALRLGDFSENVKNILAASAGYYYGEYQDPILIHGNGLFHTYLYVRRATENEEKRQYEIVKPYLL